MARGPHRTSRLVFLATASLLVVGGSHVPASAHHAFCLGELTTIDGGVGNDTIYGTNARDVASTFTGDDVVHAFAGSDLVCLGRGNDVAFDGYGSDAVNGGDGFDTLYLCPDGTGDSWAGIERVIASTQGCR